MVDSFRKSLYPGELQSIQRQANVVAIRKRRDTLVSNYCGQSDKVIDERMLFAIAKRIFNKYRSIMDSQQFYDELIHYELLIYLFIF